MPLAALALYFALHSVRESAPPAVGPTQSAQPAQDIGSDPLNASGP